MAEVVAGFTTEQKVSTVTNNDAAINAEIATQAPNQWLVSNLFPNDPNVTILFTRTTPAS